MRGRKRRVSHVTDIEESPSLFKSLAPSFTAFASTFAFFNFKEDDNSEIE